MRLRLAAASLVALALFTGAAAAENNSNRQFIVVAQAEVPAEVQRFLEDNRDPASLSNDELIARFRQARNLAKIGGLSPDVKNQLQALGNAARQEVVKRQEAGQQPAAKPAEEKQPEQQQAEQPETQEQVPAAKPQIPADVRKILADNRPSKELSNDELVQRYRQARSFSAQERLPADVRRKLAEMARADRAEVVARQQAGQSAGDQQQAEQPAQDKKKPPQQAGVPDEVKTLLGDKRPLDKFSNEELSARFRTARKYNESDAIPVDVRARLSQIAKQSREEVLRRQQAGSPQPPAQDQQPGSSAAELKALLADNRPLDKFSDEELRQRFRTARKYTGNDKIPADVRNQLQQIAKQSREEVLRRQQAGAPQPPASSGGQQPAGNAAQAEAKARAILNDPTPAKNLNDVKLRQRLYAMRDLLALNLVSAQTEDALRKKLAADREVLRIRIAEREGTPPPIPPKPPAGGGTGSGKGDTNINIQVILGDRRPSNELDDEELRRRIAIYRDYYRDERYDEDDRDYWETTLERDRRMLRERLIAERRQRADRLKNRGGLDIDIDLDFSPSQPQRPRYVFAEEAEDEELEGILVAPPARKVERRYSIEDIERAPEVRESMPAIEIDNVRFGFNEAFVREEEVANLDRIAEIMERIIASNPREVFMIEGHTDAVGGEDYNLKLSRERAAAIKKALTTYYVIPESNLKTVGYGERFLKIPTSEAEQENRRVSVRRVTPLLSELN
jgi:outer membrane protein OmpA-like peptidoglycan-associated protein